MARILDKVVGHESQIAFLSSAFQQDRFPSTLLFIGQNGIGKKMVALGIAQLLVCEKKSGCGFCPPCIRIETEQSEALLVIEAEKGVIKVEKAREVIRYISLQNPGRGRVVIIDGAQLMNDQTANALLKSLEEPPAETYFFLLAPSGAGLLPTIRSRSQIIRFGALSLAQIESISSVKDEWILHSAQGSVELALQLTEEDLGQLRVKALDVWEDIISGELGRAFIVIKEIVKERESALQVSRLWQQLFRDSGYYRHGVQEVIHRDFIHLIQKLAQLDDQVISLLGTEALQLENDIRGNLDRSLAFENYLYQSQHVMDGIR